MAGSTGRTGRRTGLVLLGVLLVLVALAVVADRVAAHVADQRVARQLQSQLGLSALPDVHIEGFPFLTQALHHRFPSVHVEADDATTKGSSATHGKDVTVSHLDLHLHQVTTDASYSSAKAARVDGTATLGYPTVQQLTGQQLTYAPQGRVQLQRPTTLAGISVTANVVGTPKLDVGQQTLTLADPQLTVAGIDVPDDTAKSLLSQVVQPVPVTGLPYGLSLTSVSATDAGLVAGVTGDNLNLGG